MITDMLMLLALLLGFFTLDFLLYEKETRRRRTALSIRAWLRTPVRILTAIMSLMLVGHFLITPYPQFTVGLALGAIGGAMAMLLLVD